MGHLESPPFLIMRRAFTLLEVLIVVVVIAVIAAFLFPTVNRAPHGYSYCSSCQSNLKQIGLGLLQYSQDYDERLPPARVSASVGWADAIYPYVRSTQLFQCPSGNGKAESSSDYFYNRRLARVTMDKVNIASLTVMGGDGYDDAPTWSSWARFPADAVENTESPLHRHLGSANYLFTDGHVKTLKPANVSSTYAAPTSRPTFAFR